MNVKSATMFLCYDLTQKTNSKFLATNIDQKKKFREQVLRHSSSSCIIMHVSIYLKREFEMAIGERIFFKSFKVFRLLLKSTEAQMACQLFTHPFL